MKKSIAAIAVASLVLSMAGPVFADSQNGNDNIPNVPSTPSIESVAPQSENAPTSTINMGSLTALKARGHALITQRVRALNRLNQKIDKSKLADTDKTSLKTDVTSNITSLQSLDSKLAADTDAAIAKTDVLSIYNVYRIYAVFLPKINGIIASLTLQQHVATLTTGTVANFDTKIAAIKTAGKDVTDAVTLMTDAKAKIADALSKAQTAQAGFATLKPSDFPATSDVIKTNAQLLKDSRNSLKTAEKDLVKVRTWLKGMNAKIKLDAQKQKIQDKLDAAKKKLQDKADAQKQKLENKGQKGNATGTGY